MDARDFDILTKSADEEHLALQSRLRSIAGALNDSSPELLAYTKSRLTAARNYLNRGERGAARYELQMLMGCLGSKSPAAT